MTLAGILRSGIVAVFVASTLAHAAPLYRYTLIADSSSVFDGFGPSAPLNDVGTTAFFAGLRGGGVGIFAGTGEAITTIADSRNSSLTFGFGGIAINDLGSVAFPSGLSGGGVGVFAGNGGPITTIADSNGGLIRAVGEPVSINNSGTVAFLASGASNLTLLLAGNGGAVRTLYDNGPGSPFFTFGSPAINDQGVVAFLAGIEGTGGLAGIFTGAGGPTVTIMDETGNLFRPTARPDVNNSGTAAFDAEFKIGGQGIFIGSGGPLITIADTRGPFASFPGQTPVINDDGQVAFLATLDTGGLGIFTGPDPIADKVIATGDALFGSVLSDLFTNGVRLGFNDSGQVSFVGVLADGRRVVARADPVGIPEPNTLALFGLAVAVLFSSGLYQTGRRT